MGGATAPDGSMAMQCQSCHGNMSTVGSSQRVGWFMEPNCQQCHTGTATSNNGQIRYTSVFTDTNGTVRVPVNATFATNPDTPAPGLSLYRFSKGHGGLQCSACHGSTHAEFPSTHANDNLRNAALQGHAGVMVECTSCHASMSVNSTSAFGGPHGMHPIGAAWVSSHHDYVEGNLARCQACHGTDNRGTVLSRAQGTRQLTASLDGGTVTLSLFRGAIVGCYNCHNGPNSSTANLTPAPTAAQVSGTTVNTAPLVLTVDTSPANAVLHIVVPPSFGSLAVSNNTLTYFPNDGFVGSDSFSYAAWNGAKNSALATGTVLVSASQAAVEVVAHVPAHYPAGWDVPFAVLLTAHHTQLPATATWDFGDGTPQVQATHPTHAYKVPGQYQWRVTGTADGVNQTQTGTLTIRSPVSVSLQATPSTVSLAWPISSADTILEYTSALDGSAPWVAVTNAMTPGNDTMQVVLPKAGAGYFRTRRSW